MSLAAHPQILRASQRLAKRFRDRALTLKHLRHVVFLCGGRNSQRRKDLARYIKRHAPHLFLFFAEDVWIHVSELQGINSLAMETQLANLADVLIVIVESEGTFAELGAFAALHHLRAKLLPLIDRAHTNSDSFIITGPVAWVNQDSRFRPSIFCNMTAIALSGNEVLERVNKIPTRGPLPSAQTMDFSQNPKHLLFLLSDLVAVIGPATTEQCKELLTHILGQRPAWNIESLLGLLTAIDLVRHFKLGSTTYYFRPLENGQLDSFQSSRFFDIAQERASFLSVLQAIPEGRQALAAMLAALPLDETVAN